MDSRCYGVVRQLLWHGAMRCFVIVLFALMVGCGSGSERVTLDSGFECVERPDDETGFLQPICEYLVTEFDEYDADPNTLEVVQIIAGEDWTRTGSRFADADHVFVGLSCCFTGDWAVVEESSGRVVEFILGGV